MPHPLSQSPSHPPMLHQDNRRDKARGPRDLWLCIISAFSWRMVRCSLYFSAWQHVENMAYHMSSEQAMAFHSVYGCVIFLKLFFIARGRVGRQRERETRISCSTYLCIHWLILECALTGDWTRNISFWGWRSDPLNYPARTILCVSISFSLKIFLRLTGRVTLSCLGEKSVSVLCLSLLCMVLFIFLKDSLTFFFGRLVWPPVRLYNPETNGRGTKIKADLLWEESDVECT